MPTPKESALDALLDVSHYGDDEDCAHVNIASSTVNKQNPGGSSSSTTTNNRRDMDDYEPITLEELRTSGLLTTIIPNRLHFTSLGAHPVSTEDVAFFSTDYHLVYSPYFADFGPLNMACLIRFCRMLRKHLSDPRRLKQEIVYYTSHSGHQRANAGYLIACFTLLVLGKSAVQVHDMFSSAYPPFLPFRDASYGISTFNVTLLDCLQGLEKAKQLGWIDIDTFDVEEYELYDLIDKGDWNWIVPKQFIAFSSPVDGVAHRGVAHVAQAFRDRKVRLILRLNENLYDRRGFTTLGIEHVDMQFPDGSVPSDGVANQCLKLMEKAILGDGGVVAVHCKAGLGRTGTIIGLYLMKHFGFSAREVIAWCRICRPGSVIGPQQQYLECIEHRLRRVPLHAMKISPQTHKAVIPVPAATMPVHSKGSTFKKLPPNLSAEASFHRLPLTTNAAEAHRSKLEAKAKMYDETYTDQEEMLEQYKYRSSKSDALKSAKSPTRKASTIHTGSFHRRVIGDRSATSMSSSTPDLIVISDRTSPAPGATARATSQLSFFSATSAMSTHTAVNHFYKTTLQRNVAATGSVSMVLPEVCPIPAKTGLRGPGWLRPMEHPTMPSDGGDTQYGRLGARSSMM